MDQYKISIAFKWQLGFLISYQARWNLSFSIPFMDIVIGLTDRANGFGVWRDF